MMEYLSYEWKVVDEFPNYEINKYGQIRNITTGRLNNGSMGRDGYLHVSLYKDGKPCNRMVHILVAKAFIPNPDNKEIVNHIDENKGNCVADNLEWVTRSENTLHGTGMKRSSERRTTPVIEYDMQGRKVRIWKGIPSITEFYNLKSSKNGNSNRLLEMTVKYNSENDEKRLFHGRIFARYENNDKDLFYPPIENHRKPQEVIFENQNVPDEYLYTPVSELEYYTGVISGLIGKLSTTNEEKEVLLKAIQAFKIVISKRQYDDF